MRLAGLLAVLVLGALDAGTFTPDRPTDALDQPTGHRVVDHLETGKPYRVLKTGGPEHRWCKLETPSGAGWVLCSGETAKTPAAHATAPGKCLTHCDSPPLFQGMPALTAVDREVLGMCPARPDASVSRGDVERFFHAHLDDPRIQRALSRAGRSGNREENVAWLTG